MLSFKGSRSKFSGIFCLMNRVIGLRSKMPQEYTCEKLPSQQRRNQEKLSSGVMTAEAAQACAPGFPEFVNGCAE